ncbi:MAG: hypothetical protein CALGDGBN_00711 [Pseudomonadales bacterium]|nr:hypothetical protein [Pseudomonadales bacterium]
MGMVRKMAGLASAGAVAMALSVSANAALVDYSETFEGNDCAGKPGCEIGGSPAIGKWDNDLSDWDDLTASGITVTDNGEDGVSWEWNSGPEVHFWAVKQGREYTVFWTQDDSITGCDVENMTLECTVALTSGAWEGDWSHVSFYNTGGHEVPVPGTLGLLGLGLLGLGVARRKQ